ncbi:transposase for insertion sequence element IS1328 [Yersinia pekkanenii]|uniref:Transposase for insertion sequence element IS1328 n=1 Tax=Yersinia pekkanenii TaxID=1288385 RepID=A0A0T9RDT5_9GAMM|nr:transposase for insertion sequence element IS1328 [Yersinia pekkanenii]CRY69331.1 transposase for insertion sequence element IS1328 [Yersinia pekkanenii]
MQNVTLIGIDLGKHSFHIHCQEKHGNPLLRKKFSRAQLTQFLATCQPCIVAMESCAGRILWPVISAS